MPTDAYVKFGKGSRRDGPRNTELPAILGDCTDEFHYWWCELRTTSFGMSSPENAKTDTTSKAKKDEKTVRLDKVSLTKSVDYASTQLFRKCCEAGEAKVAQSQEEKDKGIIDKVTVEVCRTAGQNKFPFVRIEYYNVKIVHFSIDMDGPEPTETVEFEYDAFDFSYQQTDPFTGLPVGNLVEVAKIEGRKSDADGTQSSGSSSSDSSSSGGSGDGGNGDSQAGGAATLTPSDSPPPLVTPTDQGVGAHFPGLWEDTGFGLLPD